jgi:hypothetical protein
MLLVQKFGREGIDHTDRQIDIFSSYGQFANAYFPSVAPSMIVDVVDSILEVEENEYPDYVRVACTVI